MNDTITLRSYAKINTKFFVSKKKESDLYHPISTDVQLLELHDKIKLTRHKKNFDELIISDPYGIALAVDESNSILKSLKEIRRIKNIPFYRIQLTKNIPVAAGLGGGSSNSARILEYFQVSLEWNNQSVWQKIGWDTARIYEMYRLGITCAAWNESGIYPLPQRSSQILLYCFKTSIHPEKTKNFFNQLDKISNITPSLPLEHIVANLQQRLYPLPYSVLNALQQIGAHTIGISGIGPSYFAFIPPDKKISEITKLRGSEHNRCWILTKTLSPQIL